MSFSLTSLRRSSVITRAVRNFWFPALTILVICLLVSALLVLFNDMNTTSGMRRSFVVMIMPFSIFCAGLTAPLLYWIAFGDSTFKTSLLIRALLILSTVFLSSYLVGWMYFQWIINVPFLPSPLWRFIIQDIFAISMPFWIVIAGAGSLKRLIRQQDSPESLVHAPVDAENSVKTRMIAASVGNKSYALNSKDISWVKAEGNYVKLFAEERFYMRHSSLTNFQKELDQTFLRVHKSHLVNLDHIENLTAAGHGDLLITLKSGEQVKCSRTYAKALREAIGLS